MPDLLPPPKWSKEELQAERDFAQKQFVLEREGDGPAAYFAAMESADAEISEALDLTDNLRAITPTAILENKFLWQILRYVCAPRVSEEDLWTLVDKKFKIVPSTHADVTADTFSKLIDPKRFPWVIANRPPTKSEIKLAKLATSTLRAHETANTGRRGSAAKTQEDYVSEILSQSNMNLDDSRSTMSFIDELARGNFSRERKVGDAKCDIPVRLKDGRLLAIECKVSNGPKNGWKRLRREIGGKADFWKQAYGTQVITGAVLSGVFDLSCLWGAQEKQNVVIFWQHDLKPLAEFIQKTEANSKTRRS